jgi:hypothetical protein
MYIPAPPRPKRPVPTPIDVVDGPVTPPSSPGMSGSARMTASVTRAIPNHMLDPTETFSGSTRRAPLSPSSPLPRPEAHAKGKLFYKSCTVVGSRRIGPAKYQFTLRVQPKSGPAYEIERSDQEFHQFYHFVQVKSGGGLTLPDLPPLMTVGMENNYKMIMCLPAIMVQRQTEFEACCAWFIQSQVALPGLKNLIYLFFIQQETQWKAFVAEMTTCVASVSAGSPPLTHRSVRGPYAQSNSHPHWPDVTQSNRPHSSPLGYGEAPWPLDLEGVSNGMPPFPSASARATAHPSGSPPSPSPHGSLGIASRTSSKLSSHATVPPFTPLLEAETDPMPICKPIRLSF